MTAGKLKQYLKESPTEWGVAWQAHVLEHVFNTNEFIGFYLVHPTIIKKVYGHKRIEAFHSTSVEGLKRLKKIQNTNKTISAFTVMHEERISMRDIFFRIAGDDVEGLPYENDIIIKLTGNLMIGSHMDIMSKPDNRGIRGIDVQNRKLASLCNAFKGECMVDIFRKHQEDRDLVNASSSMLKFFQMVQSKYPEYLPRWYAKYYKRILDFTQKNAELIASLYRNESKYNQLKEWDGSYNEVLLSHIKIEDVLVLDEDYDDYFLQKKAQEVEKLGFAGDIASNQFDIKNFINAVSDSHYLGTN